MGNGQIMPLQLAPPWRGSGASRAGVEGRSVLERRAIPGVAGAREFAVLLAAAAEVPAADRLSTAHLVAPELGSIPPAHLGARGARASLNKTRQHGSPLRAAAARARRVLAHHEQTRQYGDLEAQRFMQHRTIRCVALRRPSRVGTSERRAYAESHGPSRHPAAAREADAPERGRYTSGDDTAPRGTARPLAPLCGGPRGECARAAGRCGTAQPRHLRRTARAGCARAAGRCGTAQPRHLRRTARAGCARAAGRYRCASCGGPVPRTARCAAGRRAPSGERQAPSAGDD